MKIIIWIIAALLLNGCAVKHAPENPTAAAYNVQLGLGYLAQNDRLRAKEKLLRAVEQSPGSQETHLALAYYYETVGDTLAAEQSYQQALDIEPKAGQANNNYGAYLCTQEKYQQAIIHFERAVQDTHYYQTANAYENAALCSAKMAQFAPTAHYTDLALKQDPLRVNMLLKLSYLLEQQGHKTLAQHYLDRYQQTKS